MHYGTVEIAGDEDDDGWLMWLMRVILSTWLFG